MFECLIGLICLFSFETNRQIVPTNFHICLPGIYVTHFALPGGGRLWTPLIIQIISINRNET